MLSRENLLEQQLREKDIEIERLNDYISFYEDLSKKQNKTIERLNRIIDDVNFHIEQRAKENITDELRIELRNIELISSGIIKVVRDDEA